MRPYLAATLGLMLSASVASAHIALISPPPRGVDQKAGPCGRAGSTRGSTVTTFAPGATITVEWDETVDHPGHYRIAFDDDGNDSFQNPNNPNDNFAQTLIEPIVDKVGGRYSQQVTLPTTPCTNCTLQLVQVMTTVVPYNSFYFQCADIIIGDGGIDPEPPAAADGGCSVAGGNGVGWLVTAGVVAGIAKRRRRRTNQCR